MIEKKVRFSKRLKFILCEGAYALTGSQRCPCEDLRTSENHQSAMKWAGL